MTLDFREKGVLNFEMSDYIRGMIAEMPRDMIGQARTPAANNHLFNMNETDPVLLPEEKKDEFHHLVMQLMYLSMRGRPA